MLVLKKMELLIDSFQFTILFLFTYPERVMHPLLAGFICSLHVKHNPARFPEDFMFQLTPTERNELVTNCDQLTKLKHSSVMPHVFTESGVAMLSSVLNSDQAALINVQIIRAFIRLRRMLVDHEALRLAIEGLERRVGKNERDIQIAIKAIQSIMTPQIDHTKKTPDGVLPAG